MDPTFQPPGLYSFILIIVVLVIFDLIII
jgi:hypothetical protein